MAPDMIQVLHDQTVPSLKRIIWVLLEDWANNGDFGVIAQVVQCYAEARRTMIDMLREELDFGLIADIQSDSLFSVMSDDNYYEAWIEGEYLLTHYRLWMEKMPLHLTEPLRPKLASTEAK